MTRLLVMLQALGQLDRDVFRSNIYSDFAGMDALDEHQSTRQAGAVTVSGTTSMIPFKGGPEIDSDELFEEEFYQWKMNYYREKLGVEPDAAFLQDQARTYVTGLQWVLYYYYRGVPSWGWYVFSP